MNARFAASNAPKERCVAGLLPASPPVAHVSRSAAAPASVVRRLETSMLNDLAHSSGKAFTLSACDSSVGASSHFFMCCDAHTFLDTDCGNEHVWLCPPKDNIKEYLQHDL